MMKTNSIVDAFRQQEVHLSGPDGKLIDIPADGAIGLLALGDLGTIAWRQKRLQLKADLARRTHVHLAKDQAADSSTTRPIENDED